MTETEDPVKDGVNWYVYCGNNPVNFWDPSGNITKKEMEMFENGEMAPAAYTYLMDLTNKWYLSDSKKEKKRLNDLADAFRKTGYKRAGNAKVDANIAYMPSKPTKAITQEQHYFRNELNLQYDWDTFQILQKELPKDMKWRIVASDFHQNHTDGGSNVKYVSADGHFEVVFNAKNKLQTAKNNYADMGTYNYYSPMKNPINHGIFDVAPYKNLGNTVEDLKRIQQNLLDKINRRLK